MADVTTVEGVALAYSAREFQSFTNRSTGEVVPSGVSRTLWIGADFSEDPIAVQVPEKAAPSLAGVERGSLVVCELELRARGDRITRRLLSATVSKSAAHSRSAA